MGTLILTSPLEDLDLSLFGLVCHIGGQPKVCLIFVWAICSGSERVLGVNSLKGNDARWFIPGVGNEPMLGISEQRKPWDGWFLAGALPEAFHFSFPAFRTSKEIVIPQTLTPN